MLKISKLKFIWIIAMLCVVVSCTKEGQYQPKKKISTISSSYTTKVERLEGDVWVTVDESITPTYVSQIWSWNESANRVESISFYNENGELEYTDYFRYHKDNRLESIFWNPVERYDFIYLKDMLTAIKYYHGSTCEAAYVFSRSGKRIGKITYTAYRNRDGKAQPLPSCVLDFPLSIHSIKGLEQVKSFKGGTSCEYLLQWDKAGDNVDCIAYQTPTESLSFLFTYDNKSNPLYKLWEKDATFGGEYAYANFSCPCSFSKNNITLCSVLSNNKHIMDIHYTYSYEGDYPSSATWSYQYVEGDERHSVSMTTIYEYE